MNKLTNCSNCGAPLKYTKIQNNIVKCEYCSTEYYFDDYGEFKGQYVTLYRDGEEKRFYIGEEEVKVLWGNLGRDVAGIMHNMPICKKRKITLIEI